MLLVSNGLFYLFQKYITAPDSQHSYPAELVKYVVMARSLSAITVGAVPMETPSAITTLFQNVVALIKRLALVNAWRGILGMKLIKMVLIVGVVVAVPILPRTQTKQTVNNPKPIKT